MENNQDDSFLQMNLDNDGSHILNQTVRWSRFLAIAGIVGILICLLAFALAGSFMLAALSKLAPGLDELAGLGSAIIIVFVLVIFAIVGYVVYMLFRFSVLTRKAIEQQDQTILAEGMKCLKTYFLINGIFAILGLLGNLFTITKLFHS
jgi:heme/copper-type cytochrome/quinol oxidase subunit 2